MTEIVNAHQLLKVQHVPVVQAIDLLGLESLLQQVLQNQKDTSSHIQRQQMEIDALKAAQDVKPPTDEVGKDDADSNTGAGQSDDPRADMALFKDQLSSISERLAYLEGKLPHPSCMEPGNATCTPISVPAARTTDPGDMRTDAAASEMASSVLSAQPTLSTPNELAAQQQLLSQQVYNIAASYQVLQQQLVEMQDLKADRADVRNMLSDGLQTKADNTAVAQLRKQIDDKADKSELDAMLSVMSSTANIETTTGSTAVASEPKAPASTVHLEEDPSAGATHTNSSTAAHNPNSADSSMLDTNELQASAEMRQQLSKVLLQMALLQDRLSKKVDAHALHDALDAANVRLGDMDTSLDVLQERLASAQAVISSLQHSFTEHMADPAMHAAARAQSQQQPLPPAQPAAHASHSEESAFAHPAALPVSAHGTAGHVLHAPHLQEDVQLLAAKVAALEQGLAVCKASQATTNPARTAGSMSNEPDAASKLVQALALQLSDLAAQVASLSASSQQGHQPLGSSSSAQPLSTGEVPSITEVKAAPADASAGRWGIVMAAELEGRLAALEADMQDVKAAKADQTELQNIRMLWENAASQVGVGACTAVCPVDSAPCLQHGLLGSLQSQVNAQNDSLEHLAKAILLCTTGHAARVNGPQVATVGSPYHSAGPSASLAEAGAAEAAGCCGDELVRPPADQTCGETCLREHTEEHGHTDGSADAAAAGMARPTTAKPMAAGRIPAAQGVSQADAMSRMRFRTSAEVCDRQEGSLRLAEASKLAGFGADLYPGQLLEQPHMSQLKQMLEVGQVTRKMDWFDPTLLQKMAQRLAAIDALLRNSAAGGASGALGEQETKLRRLAADVRQLKDKLTELATTGTGTAAWQGGLRALGQAVDGDYSMLSGKPLGGYRCMACDRPLGSLDSSSGPYLPTGQLPVTLTSGAEVTAAASTTTAKMPPAGRRTTDLLAASTPSAALAGATPEGGKRQVVPHNWFTGVHGPAAEQLPRGGVGPQLPPGGWRGTQPLTTEAGALLMRGGTSGSSGGLGGMSRVGTAGTLPESSSVRL